MTPSKNLNSDFARTVETALEHYARPTWLGNHSPLASAYFLGSRLKITNQLDEPLKRGEALQQLLEEATRLLDAEQQKFIYETYFKLTSDESYVKRAKRLNLSIPTYYRHLDRAVNALADRLKELVQPAHLNEFVVTRHMIGVDREIKVSEIDAQLNDQKCVVITGASGMGKTALASNICNGWKGTYFWYTFRRGINDHASNVIYALAYFLHQTNRSSTWLQLMADRDKSYQPQLLDQLRHDLAQHEPKHDVAPILLCFDEVDVLHDDNATHRSVLSLLESLRDMHLPLLLIGQTSQFVPQQHVYSVALTGLTQFECAELLAGLNVQLAQADLAQLYVITHGNPGMIVLFGLLIRYHKTTQQFVEPSQLIRQMHHRSPFDVLYQRIWRCLTPNQQTLAMYLSVFESEAPQDCLSEISKMPQHEINSNYALLQALGVIQINTNQHIVFLSGSQNFIRQKILGAHQAAMHRCAARVYEVRARFTDAAYHLIQAQQVAEAFVLWDIHQQAELRLGNRDRARELFTKINPDLIDDASIRERLIVLCGRLNNQAGYPEDAEAGLKQYKWDADNPLSGLARELLGKAKEMQDKYDEALQQYHQAISSLNKSPVLRQIRLHTLAGYTSAYHLREFDNAKHEIEHARWEINNLEATLARHQGNFSQAIALHQQNMQLLDKIVFNHELRAITLSNLGSLLWQKDDPDLGLAYLKEAVDLFKTQGNLEDFLIAKLNLSGAYIVMGKYALGLAEAQSGLAVAERLKRALLVSKLANNAGEASYYLDQLEQAEGYIHKSVAAQESPTSIPYSFSVLGLVRAKQNRHNEAIAYYDRSLAAAREKDVGDKYIESDVLYWQGNAYLALAQKEKAKQAYLQSLDLCVQLGRTKEAQKLRDLIQRFAL